MSVSAVHGAAVGGRRGTTAPPLRRADDSGRIAVAAAVATLLASAALTPVYISGAWFRPVAAAVLVVLASGWLLRAGGPAGGAAVAGGRPVPSWLAAAGVALVPLGQLFALGGLLTFRYAPDRALAGFLPTRDSTTDLLAVLVQGSAELHQQATPALPVTGLVALTVLMTGLVAVTVDLIAVAGRQAALAGLALLVLYCVPVGTIVGGIGLLAMAAPAAGLAVLLWADQHRRLARQSPSGARSGPRPGTGAASAVRIAVLALAAGLVLGAVVPTAAEGSFASGTAGSGGGDTLGTALDPAAALQGQLTRPRPVPLLRLETTVEDPGYLRAVALDRYDADGGWSLTELDDETVVAGEEALAPLPARSEARAVDATITAVEHDDRFLPLPTSPLSVRVDDADEDDWRFDRGSGTVFGRDATTGGQRYRVHAEEPRP